MPKLILLGKTSLWFPGILISRSIAIFNTRTKITQTPKRGDMHPHERWLLANASIVRSADSLLNYVGMFIPGQSPQIEVASEGAMTALQLLSLYESEVVARYKPGISQLSVWLAAVYRQKKGYKRLAYLLAALRSGELFLETLASRYAGSRGRWRTILGLESTKVALRLGLFIISQRSVPMDPVFGRDLKPEEIQQLALEPSPRNSVTDAVKMPRSRKPLPQMPSSASDLLSSRALRPEDLREEIDLNRRLASRKAMLAEVLHIIRPLAYAILAYKYRQRPRNWTPWISGAAIEYFAYRLARDSFPSRRSTEVESDNVKERSLSLVWWAFRDPMWSISVRPSLKRLVERFQDKPILGIAATLLEDWLYLFDEYYFASATQ